MLKVITIPVTNKIPGQTTTIHTPFGDNTTTANESEVSSTITLNLDDNAQALLASILTETAPLHLTAAELAASYTISELLAAVTVAAKV